MLKQLAVAITIGAFVAAPVSAGNLAEPVMEPEIVVAESTGTGGGWVVPLLLVALVAAVVASSGGSDAVPVPTPSG
jgi:hypothetical protein